MNLSSPSQPESAPAEPNYDAVEWMHLPGGPEFDYPIDYAYAVVSADQAAGRIELLVKWQPDSYCHFHRHIGETTARVVQGEQHIYETRQFETVHKVRQVGFVGPVPDGEVHMEHGGPEGLTILFSIHSPDGRLFDLMDRDGNVLMTVTCKDFVERRLGEAA